MINENVRVTAVTRQWDARRHVLLNASIENSSDHKHTQGQFETFHSPYYHHQLTVNGQCLDRRTSSMFVKSWPFVSNFNLT